MTYDQECYDLGASYLRDKETENEEVFLSHADALAQRIQKAIEDYLEERGLIGRD